MHNCIISKANLQIIGIIAKLRHFVPVSTLHNIYRCLILPYITYGLIVWGHASKRYMSIRYLIILQKRALRLIYFKKYKEHAIPLFIESKIVPINMLCAFISKLFAI